MSDPEKTEKPPEKETVAMAKVPDWAIELTRSVKSGIAEVRADISLVSNDLGVVKDRVTILESERAKLSGGVRGLSSASLETDAKLAQALLALEEEKAKHVAFVATAATKDDLKEVTKGQTSEVGKLVREAAASSMGKKILTAAGVTALLALGSANLWLQKAHHEPQAPVPVFVPVRVAVDGGLLP